MRINRLFCGVKCCRINLDLVMKSHRSVRAARFFVLINQFSSVSPKVVRVVSNGERRSVTGRGSRFYYIYTPAGRTCQRAAKLICSSRLFAGKKRKKECLRNYISLTRSCSHCFFSRRAAGARCRNRIIYWVLHGVFFSQNAGRALFADCVLPHQLLR